MSETIDNFFNTRLVNYASYDNLRKIASCIDGLKNASRKVMYTVVIGAAVYCLQVSIVPQKNTFKLPEVFR